MSSSNPARIVAIVFGLLAVLAIPVACRGRALHPVRRPPPGARRSGAVGVRARPDRDLGGPARPVPGRPQRLPLRRANRPLRPVPRVVGPLCLARRRPRARRSTRCFARLGSSDGVCAIIRRVRDREQPPGGAHAPPIDFNQAEQATKIRAKLPARARGRALRAAPVPDLRQGLPAHLRRLPRPRRPAVRRRVQLALRHRRRPRRARAPLFGAARAPDAPARDRHRPARGRPRRDRHARRHERLADVRVRVEGAEGQPSHAEPQEDHDPAAARLPRDRSGRGARRTSPSTAATRPGACSSRGRSRRGAPSRSPARTSGSASARPRTCASPSRGKRVEVGGYKPVAFTVNSSGVHGGVSGSARGDRRHRVGARPRRPDRPERPVPRAVAARAGSRAGRGARSSATSPTSSKSALREGLRRDLLVISGGLGPTHDDRTVELLALAAGRRASGRRGARGGDRGAVARRRRAAEAAVRRLRARRAQAGDASPRARSSSGSPAPRRRSCSRSGGLRRGRRCRGRRASSSRSGPTRSRRAPLQAAARTRPRLPERRVLRFYGVSESAVARRSRGRRRRRRRGRGDDLRARLRDPRRSLRRARRREARADELERRFVEPIAEYLFTRTEETPIEELVLDLCRERGLTLATAESCTGGLVAARLTSVPGSSDVFVGGDRRLRERGQGGRARRPGRGARCARRGVGRDGRRRWRAARESGSAPTSPSR